MSKRFTSEQEIIELIDKYKAEEAAFMKDASEDDILADNLRYTKEASRISGLRDEAEKKRTQAAWRRGRLETLKQKLGEFRSGLLPECGDDTSVQTA